MFQNFLAPTWLRNTNSLIYFLPLPIYFNFVFSFVATGKMKISFTTLTSHLTAHTQTHSLTWNSVKAACVVVLLSRKIETRKKMFKNTFLWLVKPNFNDFLNIYVKILLLQQFLCKNTNLQCPALQFCYFAVCKIWPRSIVTTPFNGLYTFFPISSLFIYGLFLRIAFKSFVVFAFLY